MGFCNTTELQNVFLKLTQCYCNIKQVSEPEVGRFTSFSGKKTLQINQQNYSIETYFVIIYKDIFCYYLILY